MNDRPALTPPDDSKRVIVFGRTGSGKTVGALDELSRRSWTQKPWVIFDYKGDPLIAQIEDAGAREIDVRKKPPTKPGLFIVRPDPEDRKEVNDFLGHVWRQEETGLFFDEGFYVPQHRPFKNFDSIMITGRSRNIPVIACYQRPAWLSQFMTSQADYFRVYHLLKPEDREKANEYIGETKGPNGEKIGVNYRLPAHYSLWYDVASDRAAVLRPSPPPDVVLEAFARRLNKRRGLFG